MTPERSAMDMTFEELAGLRPQDWIEKIKEWIKKLGDELDDYEVSSVTFNVAFPPSASITVTKREASQGGSKAQADTMVVF